MLLDRLAQKLGERDAEHTRRRLRVSMDPCSPQVRIGNSSVADANSGADFAAELLAFCSNDYLGLANHPELVAAWSEGAQRYGVGSGASHLISGHSVAHARLEQALARIQAPYIPGAQALYFSTGYMANLAVLTALGSSDATLFCDKLNHASLIDGALLAQAKMQRYPAGDTERLAHQLEQCTTPLKLIVTDAVFSMDGSIAPLPELLRLAERHDAWVVLDDAHGFGVLGDQGQGSLAHFNLCSERFIYIGTLGKAAGVAGAFVVAHPTIVDWLINTGRSYIYTTASSPAQAHAVLKSLQLIAGEEGAQRRAHLRALVQQLRAAPSGAWRQRGWSWVESITAIQPLMIGDNGAALRLSTSLEAEGLWVPAIRPPTVPVGTARLRITLSAAHTHADVDRLLTSLTRAAGAAP
jgi:8-amino-7-oxononanoate synthase